MLHNSKNNNVCWTCDNPTNFPIMIYICTVPSYLFQRVREVAKANQSKNLCEKIRTKTNRIVVHKVNQLLTLWICFKRERRIVLKMRQVANFPNKEQAEESTALKMHSLWHFARLSFTQRVF